MDKVFKSPIAEPMADEKLTDLLLKITKKRILPMSLSIVAKDKEQIRRGVKEVVKAITRDKAKGGLVLICGDISPIEVVAHLPVFCEEREIAYIYIPSRDALGEACRTKRPTSCALLTAKAGSEYFEKFNQIVAKVKKANPYL